MKIHQMTLFIPGPLYFRLNNKCKFYDISMHTVILELVERFVAGEFDDDFGLPKD